MALPTIPDIIHCLQAARNRVQQQQAGGIRNDVPTPAQHQSCQRPCTHASTRLQRRYRYAVGNAMPAHVHSGWQCLCSMYRNCQTSLCTCTRAWPTAPANAGHLQTATPDRTSLTGQQGSMSRHWDSRQRNGFTLVQCPSLLVACTLFACSTHTGQAGGWHLACKHTSVTWGQPKQESAHRATPGARCHAGCMVIELQYTAQTNQASKAFACSLSRCEVNRHAAHMSLHSGGQVTYVLCHVSTNLMLCSIAGVTSKLPIPDDAGAQGCWQVHSCPGGRS